MAFNSTVIIFSIRTQTNKMLTVIVHKEMLKKINYKKKEGWEKMREPAKMNNQSLALEMISENGCQSAALFS